MYSREFIDTFLKDYSAAEIQQINKDLQIAEMLTFDSAKPHDANSFSPMYVATAGGPGTAKTTTIQTYLRAHRLTHYVYVDTDQMLKNMVFTYIRSLTNFNFALANSNIDALTDAYNQWRAASNYIAYEMLQIAFGKEEGNNAKYNVAHGATSTSPHIVSLYQKLKALGYRISLLLCYNEEETRQNVIEIRGKEQAFVQVDPKDILSKGLEFLKRFNDYFDHADVLTFYWNNDLTHGILPAPCASFNRSTSTLTVINEVDWHFFCRKYLHDVKKNAIEICQRFVALIPKNILEAAADPISPFTKFSFYSTASTFRTHKNRKLMRHRQEITYVPYHDIFPNQIRYSDKKVIAKSNKAIAAGALTRNTEQNKWEYQFENGTSLFSRDKAFPVVISPFGYVLIEGLHDVISSIRLGAEMIPIWVDDDMSGWQSDFWQAALVKGYAHLSLADGNRINPIKSFRELINDHEFYFASITARKYLSTEKGYRSTGAEYPLWIKIDKDIPFIEFKISDALSAAEFRYNANLMGNKPDEATIEQARTILLNANIPGLRVVPTRTHYEQINVDEMDITAQVKVRL